MAAHSAAHCILTPSGEIDESGLAELDKGLLEQEPLSVLTVTGGTRVGKSWLSSYTIMQECAFTSNHGLKSCTKGAYAFSGRKLSELRRLHGIEGELSFDRNVVVVDLEGKGYNLPSHDNQLLLPVLLLSRSVIFLTNRGGVAKQALLSELEAMLSLKNGISARSQNAAFGALHIVVNGATGDLSDNQQEVESWLEIEPAIGDREALIQRQNGIRVALKDAFLSVSVHALPPPSEDPSWIQLRSGPFDGVSSRYRRASTGLFESVFQQLEQPHVLSFGGVVVTGRTFPNLLREFSSAARDSGLLDVPSATESMQLDACETAARVKAETFQAVADDLMSRVRQQMTDEDTLAHGLEFSALMKELCIPLMEIMEAFERENSWVMPSLLNRVRDWLVTQVRTVRNATLRTISDWLEAEERRVCQTKMERVRLGEESNKRRQAETILETTNSSLEATEALLQHAKELEAHAKKKADEAADKRRDAERSAQEMQRKLR
eukprot:Rmarinus@m.19230